MTKKSRDRRKLERIRIRRGWKKIDDIGVTIGMTYKNPFYDTGFTKLTQEDIDKYRCNAYKYIIP